MSTPTDLDLEGLGRPSKGVIPTHLSNRVRANSQHTDKTRQRISAAIVDRAHGFPYSRRLEAHKSCVNALEFSLGEGRFLASGGDDRQICLWDFYQDDVKKPSYSLKGPTDNIFSIKFSATNKYLFRGGSSQVVLKYDIATLGLPIEAFTHDAPIQYVDHDASIRAITCHPTQDDIFMTASEDGSVRRHDVRQSNRSGTEKEFISMLNEITGVQYHPRIDHFFITSDGGGNVFLWDARMAFRSKENTEGIVQRYNTRLTRRSESHLSNPESSNVVFDREGTNFAVTFLYYVPTIYALCDPDPVAVLGADSLPDGSPIPAGQRTYSNSCTMKQGAFGGPGMDTDTLYAAGSDDFKAYVWKIPPLTELMEARQKIAADEWSLTDSKRIAFTENKRSQKVLPVELSRPLCWLTGHESIVNTVAFHPHLLHVVTAGVERRIVLHSPTPSSPCTQNLTLSPTTVRQLTNENSERDSVAYMSALFADVSSSAHGDDHHREERRTLSLFDYILREEGEADVFSARHLGSTSSSTSEDEHESTDEEDLLSI